MSKIFITTTLPYINSDPHVGHLLEFVQADVIARYSRGKYDHVRFNVGLDEHGLKIYEKAKEHNVPVQDYCDHQALLWEQFLQLFHIGYDVFYRTTSEEHIRKVSDFWIESIKNDDLYRKTYKGLYCVGCEAFKTEKDLVNGKCPDHDVAPQETEETNWFFRLSKYKAALLKWLDNSPEFLLPSNKTVELRNIIENSEDISVSRLKKNVPWGVEVPNDPDQVCYVWYSALLNYIFAADYDTIGLSSTRLNYWNDKTVQLCGKDNLRFQGDIFQSLLEAAGIKHTTTLLVHGTVLDVNGKKMSKSVGNVIDPRNQLKKFGTDAVRYYVIAGLTTFGDGCWSESDLIKLYNSDLAGVYGNLLNRVLHLIDKPRSKNPDIKSVEITGPDHEFSAILDSKFYIVENFYKEYNLHAAAKEINEILKFGNKYITDAEPWLSEHYPSVLNNLYSLLNRATDYLYPIIPESAERAKHALTSLKKVILFPMFDIGSLVGKEKDLLVECLSANSPTVPTLPNRL